MSDPTGRPPGWQSPPPGWPQPPQQPVNGNVQARTVVVAPPSGPGFAVRVVWYIFIGWWLTAIVIGFAYFCALSIIGLPVAFYLFNRIPLFLTLRARSRTYRATTSADGSTYLTTVTIEQHPMWVRALWFIFVGWWAGAIWMLVAYVLCLLILTMPIGVMMFDRVGGVMTLLRY